MRSWTSISDSEYGRLAETVACWWLRLRGYCDRRAQRARAWARGRHGRAARPHAGGRRGEGSPRRPSRRGRGDGGRAAAAAPAAGRRGAARGRPACAHGRGSTSSPCTACARATSSRRFRSTLVTSRHPPLTACALRSLHGRALAHALAHGDHRTPGRRRGTCRRRRAVVRRRRPRRPRRPGGAPARAQRHRLGRVPLPGAAADREPGTRAGAQGGIGVRPRRSPSRCWPRRDRPRATGWRGSPPRPSSGSTAPCGPCAARSQWRRPPGGWGSTRSSSPRESAVRGGPGGHRAGDRRPHPAACGRHPERPRRARADPGRAAAGAGRDRRPRRRARPAAGAARARDRRRGCAQPAHDRAARVGQDHARPPARPASCRRRSHDRGARDHPHPLGRRACSPRARGSTSARSAPRITPHRRRHSWATPACGRARSPWPIAASSSWTSCPSSTAPRSRRCACRSRTARCWCRARPAACACPRRAWSSRR